MRQKIKSLIGPKMYANLRAVIVCVKGAKFPNFNSNLQSIVYGERGSNCFFGYYDIQQFSQDESKILAHRVGVNANPLKDDAEIGYYEVGTNEFIPVIKTRAWCWQQGSRLRWHPLFHGRILYNDIENGCYVCRDYDVNKKKIVCTYGRALYDVSSDFTYGLSLDYSRLQRLRPGYGYGRIPDQTTKEKLPKDGGIYKIDLHTGEEKILIPYKRLVENYDCGSTENHYINHISISPDGTRFMFFHIISDEKNEKWKTCLFVSDKEGRECILLEDRYVVSHYCWKNDHTLLITAIFEGKTFYEEIDLDTMTRERVIGDKLNRDGHPTYLKQERCIITDTYPNREGIQMVLYANFLTGEVKKLAAIKHYPFLFGERRCDLHPRVAKSNEFIVIDSLHKGKNRNMIMFLLPR